MKSALRRYILLPALVIYSGLLLFAAAPDEIRPDAVADVQTQVRNGFKAANLRPYAFVFAGKRGRWKRRSVILTAHAQMPGGELERVFAAPEAPLEGFRFVRPAEETLAIKSLVISPANTLMTSLSKAQRRSRIRRLRANPRIARLSRFACYSTHAAAGRADRVFITMSYDTIDYQTGRIAWAAHVIQMFDCRRNRPMAENPWPAARLEADGMPRPVPGKADRIFLGWGSKDGEARRSPDGRKTRRGRKARSGKGAGPVGVGRGDRSSGRALERKMKGTPGKMLKDIRPTAPRQSGPTLDALRELEAGDD